MNKFLDQLHLRLLKLIDDLPCKQCIVLPRCMNKDKVVCPILKTSYTYLSKYVAPCPNKSDSYTQLLMNEITKCFKKQLMWIDCPDGSDMLILTFTVKEPNSYSTTPKLRGW